MARNMVAICVAEFLQSESLLSVLNICQKLRLQTDVSHLYSGMVSLCLWPPTPVVQLMGKAVFFVDIFSVQTAVGTIDTVKLSFRSRSPYVPSESTVALYCMLVLPWGAPPLSSSFPSPLFLCVVSWNKSCGLWRQAMWRVVGCCVQIGVEI